jgi:NADH-quinone oxidoreductase subunit G
MSASSEDAIQKIAFTGVRGLEGVKEAVVTIGDKELKFAIVSGLANARALIEKVKSGEAYYDLIEVMTCPGGCINGAGQPVADLKERIERSKGIYGRQGGSAGSGYVPPQLPATGSDGV